MIQDKAKDIQEIIEKDIWGSIQDFLNWGFHYGEGSNSIHITIGLLLLLTVAFFLTGFVLKWVRRFFTRKMDQEDKLKFISIFKFIKYVVYLVVILLTMSAAGINVTVILTASAALFVGLGLALQELFQDIIGGVFIIVDKSLRVGDIVEVEGKVGKVFEIKLRTTRALTRDDKVIIIPNHKFISDIIHNYTQNHKTTREKVSVGVAYGSDVELVTRLLTQVVNEQKGVLKNPKPFVLFEDFGDSALLFSVNFYTNDSFGDPKIKSSIRYAIDTKFRVNNVRIPFPQRDVHLFQHIKSSDQ
ncbi:mechanosensitive ion channel family protein [Croceitalea rosinachiae]|uniref:Mechanosensitive ion channel n=1 Tax=Croceitalea rosinachiae TaxID=3075596 RepID=A0ABU3ADZ0_9FLAO|nr:mechanosensitive ion channel domain-containing protein [Croceitalea sp. F388]MDT0608204.1 mechanosensitive ion channel [Croceitalea sp. F388]